MKKASLRATSTRFVKVNLAFPLEGEMKPLSHTACKLAATEEYRVLTAFIV